MQFFRANIIWIFLAFALNAGAQESMYGKLGTGSDLSVFDSLPMSMSLIEEGFIHQTEVVFCPAGIKRSSISDRKKRYAFDWTSKYNTIYLRNEAGIVFEGMNQHGFSASLMFLEECDLPEKEKELIPIAASLAVNFFIDHFACIDTALLAVWDIRIYDDLGLEGGWPFRIILHDTTGASAYIEYINDSRQVYTPDPPAFVISGPDYSRLIKLEHLPEVRPQTKIEKLYLDILHAGYPPNTPLLLLKYYMDYFGSDRYYSIFRYPHDKELYIMTPDGEEAVFKFSETEFTPGKEVSTRFF